MDDEDNAVWRSRLPKFLERKHEEFTFDWKENLRNQDKRRRNHRELVSGAKEKAENSSRKKMAGKVSVEASQSHDSLQCHSGELNLVFNDYNCVNNSSPSYQFEASYDW